MTEYGWLDHYPDEKGIAIVLTQFSKRIPFENDLTKCMGVFLNHKKHIEQLFKTFQIDIQEASKDFILENKLEIF